MRTELFNRRTEPMGGTADRTGRLTREVGDSSIGTMESVRTGTSYQKAQISLSVGSLLSTSLRLHSRWGINTRVSSRMKM